MQFFPRRRFARQLGGEFLRPLHGAADDADVADPFVDEITERLFSHLAGSDDEDLLIVEPFKEITGVVGHGDAGNAHPLLLDGGLRSHALGHAQSGLKRGIRQRPHAAGRRRQFVGLLHLRENLSFADHHAVQARRHREQVPHKVLAGPLEEVVEHLHWVEPVKTGQKFHHVMMRRARFRRFAGHVQFHAVARGEQHRLRFRILLPQPRQGIDRLVLAERQPLPHLHRSRMMAAAHHLQLHRSSSVG